MDENLFRVLDSQTVFLEFYIINYVHFPLFFQKTVFIFICQPIIAKSSPRFLDSHLYIWYNFFIRYFIFPLNFISLWKGRLKNFVRN